MTENIFRAQLKKLSPELRELVSSPELGEQVQGISKKYNLAENKIKIFGEALTKVLLQLISLEEMQSVFRGGGFTEKEVADIFLDLNSASIMKVAKINFSQKDDVNGIKITTNQETTAYPNHSTISIETTSQDKKGVEQKTETNDDLEKTLSDLDTILKPDPTDNPHWINEEAGDRQKILHEIEVPPSPERKGKRIFEKKLDDNLYRQDIKKKPSDEPTIEDETHKKISNDPYREQIP